MKIPCWSNKTILFKLQSLLGVSHISIYCKLLQYVVMFQKYLKMHIKIGL